MDGSVLFCTTLVLIDGSQHLDHLQNNRRAVLIFGRTTSNTSTQTHITHTAWPSSITKYRSADVHNVVKRKSGENPSFNGEHISCIIHLLYRVHVLQLSLSHSGLYFIILMAYFPGSDSELAATSC